MTNAESDLGPAAMVLGLDSHGLAVARALADAGVPVYALERDMSLPGVRSNRVRRVFPVQSFAAEHLVPALLEARRILARHTKPALLAINDRHVAKIAAHLRELQPAYGIAWAEKASQLVQLQNKIALQTVCELQGLHYPRSVTFSAVQDHALAADLRYPLILKPSRPLSSFKTLLAQDAAELKIHLETHPHDLPILCQEYVPGDDRQIYFGALMLNRGQVVGALAGRKIESYPPARGQTTIAETVDAPEVLQLTEQFFAGMGLTGPVSLELKRDPQGRYWVIEPTVGRTDFWAKLCIEAGFNQPLMEYQLATGQAVSSLDELRPSVWYDTERDPLAYLRLCWACKTLRPHGKAHAFTYLARADSAPLRAAVLNVMTRRFRQLCLSSRAKSRG
jgi:predicted ATP-grasp superfamily ATP-dependent carboligase